jgi:pseudouridine-5'-phosphate glycosidase
MTMNREINLKTGILVAVPVPADKAADPQLILASIN